MDRRKEESYGRYNRDKCISASYDSCGMSHGPVFEVHKPLQKVGDVCWPMRGKRARKEAFGPEVAKKQNPNHKLQKQKLPLEQLR